MVALYTVLLSKYDIIFIEDPLAEDDWDGFAAITAQLGQKIEVGRLRGAQRSSRHRGGTSCGPCSAHGQRLPAAGTRCRAGRI